MAHGRRFRIATIRGEPYLVGKRKLIPKARVVSYGRARGSLGQGRLSGWGFGFAAISPLAIIEETDRGEDAIPVADATSAEAWKLLGAILALTLLFTWIRWHARR